MAAFKFAGNTPGVKRGLKPEPERLRLGKNKDQNATLSVDLWESRRGPGLSRAEFFFLA